MIKINTRLHRKECQHEVSTCLVEKTVTLPQAEFAECKENLLADYDFIEANIDSMYTEIGGVCHCLLVLGEGYDDGILVLSEGYHFAKYSAYIPNAKQMVQMHEAQTQSPAVSKLKDLIGCCRWEDVHLVHTDIDNSPTTISELSMDGFTEEGRKAWADVLNADVARVFTGVYGLQIELFHVKADRLDDFSRMMAGYCSHEDYMTWINDESIDLDRGLRQDQ
ncbi:MAG: DUF6329 domain-containing protein [Saccharofermentanales bacterium]